MLKKVFPKAAAVVMFFCVVLAVTGIPGFSSTVKRTIEVTDVQGKVLYNVKELQGTKLFVYNNEIYMPLSLLTANFNKSIEKDSSGSTVIKDKPDTQIEALKSDAVLKDARIKELETKVSQLQFQMAEKVTRIPVLEQRINSRSNEYEGIPYVVLISGDEDEVRLKIEIDTDESQHEWTSLKEQEKLEFIENISDEISDEYPDAIIKGYVIDIAKSKQIYRFYSDDEGKIKYGYYKNYSRISELEDRFNRDNSTINTGLHLTYKLSGNENNIYLTACLRGSKYIEKWEKTSDSVVKNALRRINNDILTDFKNATVCMVIHDTDNGMDLGEAWQYPQKEFYFKRLD